MRHEVHAIVVAQAEVGPRAGRRRAGIEELRAGASAQAVEESVAQVIDSISRTAATTTSGRSTSRATAACSDRLIG